MKAKKVIIFSHNASRDYQSDSILALELKKMGYSVWLNTFLQDDGNKISIIKPDIIVLPEIRCEYTLFLAEQCKKYGIQVVVKMCEFGISEESLASIHPDYKEAIFGRFSVAHCVDLFLAWGKKMKSMMVEHMGIPEEKIAVCGGFQFDPYFLPPPPIKKPAGKTVLFAAGFPYADRNPQYAIPEARPDSVIQRQFVDGDASVRGKWLEIIPKFIDRFPDWTVIVKPHPGEKLEPYKSILGGLRCVIEAQVSGFMSIQRADFLIHAGSTMGYEAHLKKIPSINLCNNCQDVVVSKVSPNVDTFEQLVEAFDTMNPGSSAPDEILCLLSDYYGLVDGKGCERIVQAMNALPDTVTQVPDTWEYPKEPKFKTENVFVYVEGWRCEGCKNNYFVAETIREMVKCPYCGIANVKVNK